MSPQFTVDSTVDLQSCIACLTFLLSSATRFSCDSSALQSELQQLGLPHEHSSSIKRVFEEHNSTLFEVFKKKTIQGENCLLTFCYHFGEVSFSKSFRRGFCNNGT